MREYRYSRKRVVTIWSGGITDLKMNSNDIYDMVMRNEGKRHNKGESVKDIFVFIFGGISIVSGILLYFPQYYKNWKNGSTKGFSKFMLLLWFIGDTSNLIGTLLTQQLFTQILLASAGVMCDILMFLQVLYYHVKEKRAYNRKKATEEVPLSVFSENVSTEKAIVASAVWSGSTVDAKTLISDNAMLSKDPKYITIIGTVFGWICGAIYISAVPPQIYENFRLKSTHGASIWLFILVIIQFSSNIISIMLKSIQLDYLIRSFPFLLPSFIIVVLNMVILFQFYYYRNYSGLEVVEGSTSSSNSSSEDFDKENGD